MSDPHELTDAAVGVRELSRNLVTLYCSDVDTKDRFDPGHSSGRRTESFTEQTG